MDDPVPPLPPPLPGEPLEGASGTSVGLGVALWSGRDRVVPADHALHGIVTGHLPRRRCRGDCDILSPTPSLWFHVAEALGFRLRGGWVEDKVFAGFVKSQWPGVSLVSSYAGLPSSSPDVVFGSSSMLPPGGALYWRRRLVPHLVMVDSGGSPPEGWHCDEVRFAHSHMGGSTDEEHTLALWVPRTVRVAHGPYLPLPQQAWAPVEASINSVVSAEAVGSPPRRPPLGRAAVHWWGSDVSPFGLFPVAHLSALVCCPCVFNVPDKWGRRWLQGPEVAALWDVPILLSDFYTARGLGESSREFTLLVPGKILLLVVDFLMSSRSVRSWGVEEASADADRVTCSVGLVIPPSPKVVEPSGSKCVLTNGKVKEEGAGSMWCGPGIDEFVETAVLKIDCQKADDAAVSVHI